RCGRTQDTVANFVWHFPTDLFSDFVSSDGIDGHFVNVLINDEYEPPVGGVTSRDRHSRRAAGRSLDRIANNRLDIIGFNSVFGNMFRVSTRFIVPDDIIPRHRETPRLKSAGIGSVELP